VAVEVNPPSAFWWGCAGSFAVEIVLFCHAVRNTRGNRVPTLYRKPAFIVGRILLVGVAGIISAAWGITLPFQGLAVGAATPQLVLSLSKFRLGENLNEIDHGRSN